MSDKWAGPILGTISENDVATVRFKSEQTVTVGWLATRIGGMPSARFDISGQSWDDVGEL